MKRIASRLAFAAALLTMAGPSLAEEGEGWRPGALVRKIDIPSGVPWKQKKPPKAGVPIRIADTWTTTVLQQQGSDAQRGFGGRVYFYDGRESKPIRVDGQLVVYAFDEAGRKPADNQPTRRYVFPPDQFKLHESDSDLGPSYSFWLPWDGVDGVQSEISLIARFEPMKGGTLIVGDQTRHRLPGRMPPPPELDPLSPSVMQAGFNQPQAAAAETVRTMRTTSINLPASYGQSGGRFPAAKRADTPADRSAKPAPAPAPRQGASSTPQPARTSVGKLATLTPAVPTLNPVTSVGSPMADGVVTPVSYLSVAESIRAQRQGQQFGSPPPRLPARAPLASPQVADR
ncbi:hypothetical protein Pla175_33750 [Pirellulimonas nuda]|uniref:Uncharacterized protein n=1 Tax=Pirellulimonas nuda TaxID=2528009 RepID=A0A518DES7_9BACT|nr:hypothetical protein Pla175_33750 [Pirellulimonas nuda]